MRTDLMFKIDLAEAKIFPRKSVSTFFQLQGDRKRL